MKHKRRTKGRMSHSEPAAERPPRRIPKVVMPAPGTAPGIELAALADAEKTGAVTITCVDYNVEQCEVRTIDSLPDFLAHHRPPWSHVRWINVDGTSDPEVVRALAEKYELHPLAVEDVLRAVQRPKAEDYPGSGDHPGRLFVVARALAMDNGRVRGEQVSFFLGRTTLLTFQEKPGDAFAAILPRIEKPSSRLRENDVSLLFYSLIDLIVDGFFPVLEDYSDRLEDLEEAMLDRHDRETWQAVHSTKRELLLLRRAAWPMREMISQLLRERHECLSETTRTYFRDVHDHCVQAMDLIETYRELATGLTETYMSVTANRLNEIMKVLTVISTIFVPLTFLAGVYGMNVPIPGGDWPPSFPIFWAVCITIGGGMLLWLRTRKWI